MSCSDNVAATLVMLAAAFVTPGLPRQDRVVGVLRVAVRAVAGDADLRLLARDGHLRLIHLRVHGKHDHDGRSTYEDLERVGHGHKKTATRCDPGSRDSFEER